MSTLNASRPRLKCSSIVHPLLVYGSGAYSVAPRHPKRIRVCIVESDPVRFVGFSTVFRSKRNFELCASTMSEITSLSSVDIVLLAAPGRETLFSRATQLLSARPELRILLTGSGMDQSNTILRALALGTKGCIDETASPTDFIKAVEVVHQGLIWAPRRVCSMFIDLFSSDVPPRHPQHRASFSDRETEIMDMLLLGRSNKEIGAALGLRERTVKGYFSKLMYKTGARNRVELSMRGIARFHCCRDWSSIR